MSLNLPADADPRALTRWEALAPHCEELADRPLPDDLAVTAWLGDWSRLSELVYEGGALLSIAYKQDTEDAERKEAYLSYVREVGPRLRTFEQTLKARLLETGWASETMAEPLKQFRADAAVFREANVPLLAEEQVLAARYSEAVGSLTVSFDGRSRTLPALAPYRALPDRAVREAAWRAGHEAMLGVRGDLDELFDQLLRLRCRIGNHAGFDDYRDYRWQLMGRFDYTPADARRFQGSIREVVVPALRRQAARRARALGLDALRPWDLEVDPHGSEPLRPFASTEELTAGAIRIFDRVAADLGDRVRRMRDEGLLDLANRKGKAPGGFCAGLQARGRPFIFMNAVGTDDNVRTLLHEAGHAFHVFERVPLPFIWQRNTPMEFCEVASMTMELLTAPYLAAADGGFYEPREAVRSRIQHLERMIEFLPYMATVDAFQHWAYAHPDHDRSARDAAWLALHEEFCVAADWSGLDESRESLWQHKLHIFQSPFYYIEYGLAQLGALQIWRDSLGDPAGALARYRAALALGGTRPLPDLFATAGARLAFDPETVGELVTLVERTIADLEAALPPTGGG